MSELLERESELLRLDGAIDDARAGRGRMVLVEGVAGIGKTRLLDAVRVRAREAGMTVLSGRASELDLEFPFGVVRQLFEPLLAGDRRASLLKGAASLAGPLLGQGEDEGTAADASLARLHGLYWLTANLAEEGPVALVIDDLHWADASSLRFLRFLAPRLEELPVLVALATRPAEPGLDREPVDALATDPIAELLRPAPLGEAGVASLVATELRAEPDGGFTAACRQTTGGNPFLLRELLREMEAEGVVPGADSVALVPQLTPPAVARAVLLRLARLGDDASALARAVVVLGDGAPLHRAAALAALPEERAVAAASALAGAGILAEAASLAFAHPILRAAVQGEIDAVQLGRAHRRAAALLAGEGAAADAIAIHLLAAAPSADAWVAATLAQAAARALSSGAAATGAAYLRRALAEPPPPAERPRIVLELARAELHAGEPAAAAEHFEEAELLAPDASARGAFAWEHALALQALGRHAEGYELRERAAADLAEVDPDGALLIEAGLIASAALDAKRLPWALARLGRHRSRLAGVTQAEQQLLAMRAYADAMYGDRPAEATADDAQRALGMSVSAIGSTAFFAAVEALWMADRNDAARRALDDGIERSQRSGSALGYACLAGWRCMLLARTGELAGAEADARRCAELALPQGWFSLAPPMLGFVLTVLLERGEVEDAERLLEATGLATSSTGDDLALLPALHARARLRAVRGDLAGARDDLSALARRRARWNTDLTLVPGVLIAAGLGGDSQAIERMLIEARAWGTPRAIGMATHACALLTEDGERRLELLSEAVAALAGSPARLEEARAATDLGAALRAAGRREDARDRLRGALDAASACGATPLAERARAELRAAGARPRRPRLTGVGSLTASERRIASMAAAGLSNPEIAQALFVTKKTVEAHLGSAYRKLGIRSRAQLASLDL
jgi:DNA-binding CsgD family transcriptional regulator